jgi:hypothetical protein
MIFTTGRKYIAQAEANSKHVALTSMTVIPFSIVFEEYDVLHLPPHPGRAS